MTQKSLAVIAAVSTLLAFYFPHFFLLHAEEARSVLFDGTPLPFYVYHGAHARENHYAPSGWMGDYEDLSFNDHWRDKPEDPRTAIRITYSAKASQSAGWAGIYWQNPPNNWGDRPGGYNLNGAKTVTFLARGERGDEVVSEFKVGGIGGTYADSGSASLGPLNLTKAWKRYTIDLDGQELSSIAGGFCISLSRSDNPNGAVIYLNDIRFE